MPNNYILLETIALTQSAASVTFDNLPTSGYTDLKIVMTARYASGSGFALIDFNNLSTANFSNRVLEGTGSSAISFVAGNTNYAGGIVGAGDTANTFSNTEIYIPNYRSSVAKSYSIDAVTENNGTTAYADMVAGLWNNTAAITAIKLSTHSGANFAVGSTFSLYGIAALGTTPVVAPKATGGNIVANDGTYWYHAFTSSGEFIPQTKLTADILVVAGGGAGGGSQNGTGNGGGGGAGGMLAFTSESLSATNYAVTVGAGGTGAVGGTSGSTNGNNSVFAGLTAAVGGGRGGFYNVGNFVGNGGSGGGGYTSSSTRGTGTSGQGNDGGIANPTGAPAYGGAGGGGKTSAGTNGTSSVGGNGGAGATSVISGGAATGTGQLSGGSYYFAGGGGGGAEGGTPGAAGLGGGAAGLINSVGLNATANTGGGGGGAGGTNNWAGGAGGSGIIIVRYPIN